SDRVLFRSTVKVFTQPLPYWLDLNELPFSTRTRNCLVFSGLLAEPEQLSKVTYGRLLDIRAMGAVSILEFACVAEAALERASTAPADPRFSDIIPPVSEATVLELLDNLTSGPDADRQALEQLTSALPELRKRT